MAAFKAARAVLPDRTVLMEQVLARVQAGLAVSRRVATAMGAAMLAAVAEGAPMVAGRWPARSATCMVAQAARVALAMPVAVVVLAVMLP
ncbi:hypothetical protein NO932_09900 [Pelagibacterium sp. 26DY04]|uniref:hypothetical protein n=1 Tax=Pelagibacterium sp. 26DY04 TaxID=2967130 RepID=UPI00281561F1|nr:hypothetical protein [Pelagibacterium sp. 26DY04]WMT85262.1 hypothetical protein NO932_09900 [Pelagibacterium sp. 26DY04]